MRNWLSIVLVGVGVLAIAACGGDGSGDPYGGGTGGNGGVVLNCATLTNAPADCDKSCTSDAECAASFCDNGKCTAHCTADEGCAAGSACNVSGRCVMSTGGTGGTGNTGGNGCQSIQVTPTRSIPNVMFLVDQSGSMTDNFAGQARWTAAHGAITEIVSNLKIDDATKTTAIIDGISLVPVLESASCPDLADADT